MAAVLPPELAEKNVQAILPLKRTTCLAGRADGGVRRRLLGLDAAVDLAARVGVDVEGLLRLAAHERVGPRRDGLDLERLGVPVGRHLTRYDSANVLFDPEIVDDLKTAVRHGMTTIRPR